MGDNFICQIKDTNNNCEYIADIQVDKITLSPYLTVNIWERVS